MVAFISWVLTRAVRAKTGMDATVVLLLLLMMVAMLIGPGYLYLPPSPSGWATSLSGR